MTASDAMMDPLTPPEVKASDLRSLPQLQEELANLFPTMPALQWELRQHRERYVRAQALFQVGRRLFAHRERFEQVALQIAAAKAKRALL